MRFAGFIQATERIGLAPVDICEGDADIAKVAAASNSRS